MYKFSGKKRNFGHYCEGPGNDADIFMRTVAKNLISGPVDVRTLFARVQDDYKRHGLKSGRNYGLDRADPSSKLFRNSLTELNNGICSLNDGKAQLTRKGAEFYRELEPNLYTVAPRRMRHLPKTPAHR